MASLYLWIVFVHVASVLLLLLLHGGSVAAAYAVRRERNPERLKALLDLSRLTFDSGGAFGRIFWIDLLVVAFSGIALMVMAGFWRQVWPWASLVIFVAIFALMGRLGSRTLGDVRRAAGMPFIVRSGGRRPEWSSAEPADPARLASALEAVRPGELTAIGVGGFAVILWLMVFKPF